MRNDTEQSRQLIQSRPWVEWVNEILLEILDSIDSIKEISQRILDSNKASQQK